jgi:peptidoglycan/xylan/chitin deacetylase (PgdA/CDA1 family)
MYHRISDKGGSRYTLPIDSFRAQMKLLHDEGYQTVSVSQLARVIRHGGALPEKPVVLTFDDGYSDVYQNAFPIMKEYGFTGVVYVITSTFEDDKSYGYMQPAELKELIRAGWEIGSHGVTHTDLNKTRVGPGNEMKQSKAELEKTLGVEVKTFSYPFAVANGSLKDLAEETGYQSAVGVDIFVTHLPKRLYFLSRREVHRAISISGFHKLLVPGEDELAALHLEQTATAEPGTAQ